MCYNHISAILIKEEKKKKKSNLRRTTRYYVSYFCNFSYLNFDAAI